MGSFTARGYTGYQPLDLESATGDYCEATAVLERLPIVPLEEIAGIVFEDLNLNGRKEAGERGIPGVLIKDTRGRIYRSDAEGRFSIPAGEHKVGVQVELTSIPADLVFSTSPTRLVDRFFNEVIVFGLVPCTVVKGFVFRDENANGVYEEGEAKIEGIELKAEEKEVLSGKDGEFIFTNLPVIWKDRIEIKRVQFYYSGAVEGLGFVLIEN